MYQDYSVGEHKANQGSRFINYIIDIIGYIIFCFFIGILYGLLIMIIPIENGESDLIYNIIALITLVIYYFSLETITKGRSLGKFITGTKVVMIDGSAPTTKDYLMRSICRIIPFEAFSFLGSNGWHDKFSKTAVVNKKAFEAAISVEKSIESIGNENI